MQFREAFARGAGNPYDTTQRYIFDMPGGNFMVVKVFPINEPGSTSEGYTVKVWSGDLDYKKTKGSWATKTQFKPDLARIKYIKDEARDLLEACGFAPFALVNRGTR